MDHDHQTGLFRKIVCQSCNNNDSYIKYPNGIPSKKERDRQYYTANPDKLIEKGKKYYLNHKDKINERGKIYREENKEKEKERSIKYREKNKDKLTEKFDCPCGGKYQHCSKWGHFKTKLHKDYLDSLED